MKEQNNWQSAINSQLSQRLIRPLIKPGIISFASATEIIQRSQHFSSRHPLLNNPRWSSLKHLEGEKVPIVHAQMAVPKESEVQQQGLRRNETPVVQAKRIIEGKQAFESENKLNNLPSQPSSPPAKLASQSPAVDGSNLVIQRKIDPSASQFSSQTTSSLSTPSNYKGEESSSLDGEISSPVIPTPPTSDVVVPTSPVLPETEIIVPKQQLSSLPLANSDSQNLSKTNFPDNKADENQFSRETGELNRKKEQQPVRAEENLQLLSTFANNSSDIDTSQVINSLPVVKSRSQIVTQENALTQLGKNKLEENPTTINSLLPVVQSRPKPYSEKTNSTQLRKNKQFDYPGQKKETRSVDSVIESSPRKTREDKLIRKEVIQSRTASNYPDTITATTLPKIASDFSPKNSNKFHSLPIVKPKLLASSQSNSTEKSSQSQPQRKSVIVNSQPIKPPEIKTPLVFSQGATGKQTPENNYKPIPQANNYQSITNNSSQPMASDTIVNQWLVNQNQQKRPDSQSQEKIDLNAITSQVERRLKRRLIAESERRGKKFR